MPPPVSPVLDHELCTRLSDLIAKLTNSGEKTLNTGNMKEVKNICRKGDNYVERAYHLVMTQLQREHSEVRYSCLLIMDELFRRSHKFRTLLLTDFQDFLELTAETDPDAPLPPPKAVAKNLKTKTLSFVREWYNEFKDGYKLLVLGYNFLKDCKMINFQDLALISAAEQRQIEEANRRKELVIKEKVDKVVKEMDEKVLEIVPVLDQMDNAFQLILPHPDEFFLHGDFENETSSLENNNNNNNQFDSNLSQDEMFRHHGVGKRGSYSVSIELQNCLNSNPIKTKENAAIWETLKDLHVQACKIYLPLITSWLKTLTKAGEQSKIKEVIDLKNRMENALSKCADLKIDAKLEDSEVSDESDNDFEEVEEKDGFEPVIPQHLRKEYGMPLDLNAPSTSKGFSSRDTEWSLKADKPKIKEEILDPTSMVANLEALRRKMAVSVSEEVLKNVDAQEDKEGSNSVSDRKKQLLSKAPRKNYDIDLYHWEEEKLEAPEVVKFDSLHKFWTPHENESEVRKMEDVASLRQRTIEFTGKFEPTKWTCRAPLPSGKLCPRMDKIKCPFHGPVIARDELGNPAKPLTADQRYRAQALKEKDIPDWQDPELLRDLEAATGVNLKMPIKGKRGTKKDPDSKLTNLKATETSARKRLEKKILNKASLKRVSEQLDSHDSKRLKDKFGNQWNYSFNT